MPTTEFPAVTEDLQARTGHAKVERRERVIVRFAGDSGDGMQLAGGRFTDATAVFGNDLATLPSFPAEIRAPAGSLAGVSSFQIHFAERDIATPGDTPNVLVASSSAARRSSSTRTRSPPATCRRRPTTRVRSRTTRSRASASSACR
jgi:2-oxoglutarate ferredoxin oxidoreductase subunit alpha